MNSDVLLYFQIQRQIFGVCPCCGEIFRLSDCNVYARTKPKPDWMDQLAAKSAVLDRTENRIEEQAEAVREKARERGKRQAQARIRKMDPIFAPRGLQAADAKILLNPVDFVVFEGLNGGSVRHMTFLDRKSTNDQRRAIQESIGETLHAGRVEWRTIRVADDGGMKME